MEKSSQFLEFEKPIIEIDLQVWILFLEIELWVLKSIPAPFKYVQEQTTKSHPLYAEALIPSGKLRSASSLVDVGWVR